MGLVQPYYMVLVEAAPQDILIMAGVWEPTSDGCACRTFVTVPA